MLFIHFLAFCVHFLGHYICLREENGFTYIHISEAFAIEEFLASPYPLIPSLFLNLPLENLTSWQGFGCSDFPYPTQP